MKRSTEDHQVNTFRINTPFFQMLKSQICVITKSDKRKPEPRTKPIVVR